VCQLPVDADVLRAFAEHRPATEYWAWLDRIWRRRNPQPAAAEQPVALLPAELEEGNAARWRIEEGSLSRIRSGMPSRCEDCFTLHLRRELDMDLDGEEGTEDLLLSACCGKHSCPYCWRQRRLRTLRRAVDCVLDNPEPNAWNVVLTAAGQPEQRHRYATEKAARQARAQFYRQGTPARVEFVRGQNLPRLGLLYVAETTWGKGGADWRLFDRTMRKQLPARAGRLRVRRGDDSVLVVSSAPFADARPVTPAEAAELVARAVELLHTARHAYRQLGEWNDRKPTPWKLVGRLPTRLDPAGVERGTLAAGSAARRLQGRGAVGLLFRARSLHEATLIGQAVESAIQKSLTVVEERENVRPKFPTEDRPDLEELFSPDDYDPGANTYG
jgi:hypothetical protein